MFIENVMAICDRILQRAAQNNPAMLCLQKISATSKEKQTKTPEGAN